jgi:hypothetical protein
MGIFRRLLNPKSVGLLVWTVQIFDRTRGSLQEVIKRTAGPCFFVSAVTSEESGIPLATRGWKHDINVVEKLVDAQSSTFQGKMAYSVVARTGMYTRLDSLEGLLDFFWYATYMTSQFAAKFHHFTPKASSLLIRTRFDMFYDSYFNLVPITSYFSRGNRGEHLGFAQEGSGQSDYYMMTSYGAYSRHIAGAYERGMYRLARSNGWGFGFSLCGFHECCAHIDRRNGPSLDLSPACRDKRLPYSNECCAANWPCMMTFVRARKVIGQLFIQRTNSTLGVDPASIQTSALDLTTELNLYCPANIDKTSCPEGRSRFAKWALSTKNANLSTVSYVGSTSSPWPAEC